MTLSAAETAPAVASALEQAHAREDVEQYVSLFGAAATWVTSRGVLFAGRDDLRDYLRRVMPEGLAGGSVSYRVAATVQAEASVVVVIDQEYRSADGELKSPGGRHRHTYVVAPAQGGGWEIAAGQNTTISEDS